jgi:hypothetical protein
MKNFADGGFRLSESEPEGNNVDETAMIEPGYIPWDEIPDDLDEQFEAPPETELGQESIKGQKADRIPPFPKVITAAELERRKYPQLKWLIQNILPPGVTILAGPPKSGKTRLMTHIAAALATGTKALGKINTRRAGVLFLYLEDGWRRVKTRLSEFLPDGWPSNLRLEIDWPRMGNGGLRRMDEYLERHPEVRMVIIDVLERFRPPTPRGVSVYQYDYRTIASIREVAEKHDVAIVLIHHTNKLQDAPDVFNRISGTQGLTGAVDTMMLLERTDRMQPEATLSIDGREVEAQELTLEYDPDTGEWELLGDANLYSTSDERRQIINYLENQPEPKSPKEVAEALGKNHSTTRNNMRNMAGDRQLVLVSRGKYAVHNEDRRTYDS